MLLVIRTSYGDSFLTMIKVVLACYNVPNQLKGFCCFITARLDISYILIVYSVILNYWNRSVELPV